MPLVPAAGHDGRDWTQVESWYSMEPLLCRLWYCDAHFKKSLFSTASFPVWFMNQRIWKKLSTHIQPQKKFRLILKEKSRHWALFALTSTKKVAYQAAPREQSELQRQTF